MKIFLKISHHKAFDTYPSTIKFVPECYKTQEICHTAVHRCFFVFGFIPDKYKIQDICNLAVSLYFPFIVYCPYKYTGCPKKKLYMFLNVYFLT